MISQSVGPFERNSAASQTKMEEIKERIDYLKINDASDIHIGTVINCSNGSHLRDLKWLVT